MTSTNYYLLVLCDVLSATVLITTCIYKMPQVYAIVSTGSSLGVSFISNLLEWIAYSIMLTYQYAMEYPFNTYMENTIMVAEDLLLVWVIMRNRCMFGRKAFFWLVVYCVGFVLIAMRLLPDAAMFSAIATTTPLLCWSKIAQLVHILKTGDPGRLSALTWLIASYDTAVRILTTIVITGDLPMLINLTSSEIFNVAIFVSIIFFRRRRRH